MATMAEGKSPDDNLRRGSIDECNTHFAVGWALGLEGLPSRINIFANDEPASGLMMQANRPDLAAHGINENAAFRFAFDPPLSVGAKVRVEADGALMQSCPIEVQQAQHHGFIDQITQAFVTGWAVSPGGKPIDCDVLKNGEAVGTTKSNLHRIDLAAAGFSADSAFIFYFDELLTENDTVELKFPDGISVPGCEDQPHKKRLTALLKNIDIKNGIGAEFGALDRPILSKNRANIVYIDHAGTNELKRKYSHTPLQFIDRNKIVNVDYVWSGGELKSHLDNINLLDYCIAIHVIEHVADPIGWLKKISDVLKPGGIISLAIPERNYTFDKRRDLTSLADIIDPYIRAQERPGPRQVFDCLAFAVNSEDSGFSKSIANIEQLQHAYSMALQSYNDQNYLDVHCNVFTLKSFLEVFGQVKSLGLFDLEFLSSVDIPERGEFIVQLRKDMQ